MNSVISLPEVSLHVPIYKYMHVNITYSESAHDSSTNSRKILKLLLFGGPLRTFKSAEAFRQTRIFELSRTIKTEAKRNETRRKKALS